MGNQSIAPWATYGFRLRDSGPLHLPVDADLKRIMCGKRIRKGMAYVWGILFEGECCKTCVRAYRSRKDG